MITTWDVIAENFGFGLIWDDLVLVPFFYSIGGPYLLPLWMCALLSHRALRDDRRCRAKYGALWEEYRQRATFRMVPFLY